MICSFTWLATEKKKIKYHLSRGMEKAPKRIQGIVYIANTALMGLVLH